jgi:phosphoribosylformylglycinamidine synthase
MAVVLDKKDVDKFIEESLKENLEATAVAVVTESPRLVMNWGGDTIVDVSREFLNTNGVTQVAEALITVPEKEDCYRENVPEALKDMDVKSAFKTNLGRLEVCSQIGLAERFDASIGAATVIMPFGGKTQLTPQEAMAAKIPVLKGETDDASAMSFGYIPGTSRWSPFHGSAYAVVESTSKLLAIGANPLTARLTFQEYFERLHDVPSRWGKPAAALLGAMEAQINLGLPSIGGKDSMSGSFEDLDVPPTLVSFAVAMTKASKTVSSEFKKAGSKVVYVPVPENKETLMPNWDKLVEMYKAVYALFEQGKVLSASVVKEGGCAASVAKACFGNMLGFEFTPDYTYTMKELFAPLAGSLILELTDDASLSLDITHYNIGTVTEKPEIKVNGTTLALDELIEEWTAPLEKVFPTKAEVPEIKIPAPLYTERNTSSPVIKVAKPKVFIPCFPGTNCEVDTMRAFEKAGAEVETLIVKNLKPSDIEETISAMEKAIKSSQIIMFPGGFSGGDEPDGSGKFIATTFRNPVISTAVNDLLKNRDGLALGICNGFQALIKLGLVPNGEITEIAEDAPTLTFNTIGRHISHMAYTRITSTKSPWFSGVNAGDVFAVPVSHGEGRFVANDDVLKKLIENGQVATQYVDLKGEPSQDIRYNLNGSVCAIEGITSPDGRVLGKMGHSERKGDNLYANVPFEKDMKIFESGVKYFK